MARLGRSFPQQARRTKPVRKPLRITITLKDKNSALLASVAMKVATFKYAAGDETDSNWMVRESQQTVTTSGAGVLDFFYLGQANLGDTVYIAIIEPDSAPAQSVIWTTTVV